MENLRRVLGVKLAISHQYSMAAPVIPIKLVQIRDDAGPQGIEMNIARQLQKIGLLLTDN
jgi:hypothetical protein